MEKRCDNIEVRLQPLLSIPLTSSRLVFLINKQQLFSCWQDCDDSSDEKNCRMVSFDVEKYLKNKPPSPPMGLDKLPISVR